MAFICFVPYIFSFYLHMAVSPITFLIKLNLVISSLILTGLLNHRYQSTLIVVSAYLAQEASLFVPGERRHWIP